ncbi:MAG: hypothetical protein QOD11_1989 [Bradyrhizobium sp.]|jgi:hypothetical protein|nr:hypothetical protein [Bradyrhizobium sp.]
MSSQRKKILVHDDEPERSKGWARKITKLIGNDFEVTPLSNEAFAEALNTLDARRAAARKSSKARATTKATLIDEAAVLIIDYDLLKSSNKHFLTGEAFAYLSRCYSTCGVVVVVNQFGGDVFDLTLQGHPESFADLNVGAKQLLAEGLWRDKWSGFRSWHWPVLPSYVEALDRRVKMVMRRLDEPIIKVLGMEKVCASLSGPAVQFIQGNIGHDIERITFRQFVTTNANNGLRYKDEALGDNYTARIAAARIGKWLERLVLVGQDVLVDAPHLVARFPSLLSGAPSKLESWNKLTTLGSDAPAGMRSSVIEKFRFRHNEWISRPAWFWSQVAVCKDIPEVAQPFGAKRNMPDIVFCEDLSRFVPRTQAREFLGDLPSPFVKRYAANPKHGRFKSLNSFTYAPEVRFALI